MKELEREILIIGAGPAGLSAAIEAAKAGAKVTVADEHDTIGGAKVTGVVLIGGQLYKQIHKFFGAADNHAGMRGFEIARKLEQEAKELGVEFWLSTVAYGIFKEGVGIVRDGDNFIVKAKKVIVAAGGIENTTAFPGSTLPGVMLAGAAQTMANIHRVLPGKRMVVVGSGNVGLIVAYQMLQAGAEVLAVVERDDHIGGYGVHAERLRTAGVPIFTDTVIKYASGKTSVEGVTTVKLDSNGAEIAGSEQEFNADTVIMAVGMAPLTELLWNIGCRFEFIGELGGYVPLHNEFMQTSVDGIYAAGDITGVEEASVAMEEGSIAGIAAAAACGCIDADKCKELCASHIDALAVLESGEYDGARSAARAKKLELYKASEK